MRGGPRADRRAGRRQSTGGEAMPHRVLACAGPGASCAASSGNFGETPSTQNRQCSGIGAMTAPWPWWLPWSCAKAALSGPRPMPPKSMAANASQPPRCRRIIVRNRRRSALICRAIHLDAVRLLVESRQQGHHAVAQRSSRSNRRETERCPEARRLSLKFRHRCTAIVSGARFSVGRKQLGSRP